MSSLSPQQQSPRHARTHSAPIATPQMTALDRSNHDCANTRQQQQQQVHSSNTNSSTGSNDHSRTTTWWEGATKWNVRTPSKDGMVSYIPLDFDLQQSIPTTTTTPPPRTREDNIREDCHFFFRELEDEPNQKQSHSALDSSTRIPPRYHAAYRARFQQLNSVKRLLENDDLLLREQQEDEGLIVPPQSPRVADFSKSSFYCNIDGRILMKLPKDKVRLSMDPNLEPGILSVEQASAKGKDLTYVLSVDDNLYRRVVAEIADTHSSICGIHQCCTDNGHVNIQVAFCILGFVMVLLLVNTIIYPGD
jgi:hypothetical protein